MRGRYSISIVLLLHGCFPDPPNLGETDTTSAETESEIQSDIDTVLAEPDGTIEPDSDATGAETANEVDSTSVDSNVDGSELDAIAQEIDDAPDVDVVAPDTAECQGDGQCTSDNLCDIGRCDSGRCVFEPIACVAIDACHKAGACEPTTGQCTTPSQSNGTPCDDGVRCTGPDGCLNGVCEGDPVSHDGESDFNNGVGSSNGSRAAGLASSPTEVFLAVAFPTDEQPPEESPSVDFGVDATLAHVVVRLPDSATHGVAIARYSHNGGLIDARLAATSNSPISDTSLTYLDNGGLLLTGSFEGAVNVMARDSLPVEMTTVSQTSAVFAFDHFSRNPRPMFIEQAPPYQIPPRIISNGVDCLVMINLLQDRTATFYDRDGLAFDTFSSSGDNVSEVWIAWMPACTALTVNARRLGGGIDGGFSGFAATLTSSGSFVLGGIANNGVSFGDRDGAEPVAEFASLAATLAVVTPDEARAVWISDPQTAGNGGVRQITGVASAGEEIVFGLSLVGRAEILGGDAPQILVGSPASPTQLAPRMALVKLDESLGVAWMHAVTEDKVPVFGGMDATSEDVAVATYWTGTVPFTPMGPISGRNLIISVWDQNGARWAAPMMTPIDGEEGGIVPEFFPLIRRVPLGPGLFISGTLEGRAILGVSEQNSRGGPGASTAFIARINSLNEIGCPVP